MMFIVNMGSNQKLALELKLQVAGTVAATQKKEPRERVEKLSDDEQVGSDVCGADFLIENFKNLFDVVEGCSGTDVGWECKAFGFG